MSCSVSIYINSTEFWEQDSGLVVDAAARCNPQGQINIADGVGSFIGGLLGGLAGAGGGPGVAYLTGFIGGELGSALYSGAVRAQIKQNGGRCI